MQFADESLLSHTMQLAEYTLQHFDTADRRAAGVTLCLRNSHSAVYFL